MSEITKSSTSSGTTSTSNCSRVVYQSKYEHNDPTARLWWDGVFKELEHEVSVMPHERQDVIEKIFPDIEEKLKKVLTFKQVPENIPAYTIKCPKALYTDGVKRMSAVSRYGTSGSMMTDYNEFPVGGKVNSAPPNNPYRKFFKIRADRAAIWRELPPISLDEMDLTHKAEAITENIAQNFYEWLKSLGGDELPRLDPPTIVKMFEIGFNCHAAQSLCVKVKELPAVSDSIAMARRLPNASVRVNLHHHLKKDLDAFKTEEKQIAFGKMLPLELRSMPPKEDFAKKWFDCERVPPELASMQAVWGGIEQLRSTRAFCSWLMDHPEIPPPAYLVQKGMLSKKYLSGPHYSTDEIGEKAKEAVSKNVMDADI